MLPAATLCQQAKMEISGFIQAHSSEMVSILNWNETFTQNLAHFSDKMDAWILKRTEAEVYHLTTLICSPPPTPSILISDQAQSMYMCTYIPNTSVGQKIMLDA